MKFTFEADMVRGQCYCCPIIYYDDEGFEHCGLDRSVTCLEVEPSECPLKEANEVAWHPYPKEKPPRKGVYFVCVTEKGENQVDYLYYKGKEFIIFDDLIEAWAEIYVPYKEEE